MTEVENVQVAIVDYGLGNLFSVKHACAHVGLQAKITSSKEEILEADVVILPGIGAFEDAIAALHNLDLVSPLKDIASSEKILVGICLGMQLLMTESYEFGHHQGLGLIEGPVVRFDIPADSSRVLKVPQVGWNCIYYPDQTNTDSWTNSPLTGLSEGEFMYFVHSFYIKPTNPNVVLSTSRYGDIEFCSSLQCGNIFASQFHPERSGGRGLQIYQNIATHAQNVRS
jgi:glutamine amidotransferase